MTYSSIVSGDSERIIILFTALNELYLKGFNINNELISAPNIENNYLKAGLEFVPEGGRICIVWRALYGIKSASA